MSREELIPGAFQESHDSLESNFKINNKAIEPNQMLTLGHMVLMAITIVLNK